MGCRGGVGGRICRGAAGEGRVLLKIGGRNVRCASAALAAAGLTVWGGMASAVLERRGEIAIMQGTGASDRLIASLFAAEVAVEGGVARPCERDGADNRGDALPARSE